MILADTSVWVDHLRKGGGEMAALLNGRWVVAHALVIEELACGHLGKRAEIMEMLENLPKLPQADHAEFLAFLAAHRLQGSGLGVVDIHLLASARLAGVKVWSRDKALAEAARRLGLLYR